MSVQSFENHFSTIAKETHHGGHHQKTQAILNIGCTPQQPSDRNHTQSFHGKKAYISISENQWRKNPHK